MNSERLDIPLGTKPAAQAGSDSRVFVMGLALLVIVLHVAHLTGLRNTLATLLAVSALVLLLREHDWPPLWAPVVAWLGMGLLSAAWSADVQTTLKSTLYEIVLPMGAFFGAYLVSRRPSGFMAICGAVGGGLLFLVGNTVAAYVVGQPWEIRIHDPSGVGYYYPGPGAASTLAIYALPLALLLSLNEDLKSRRLGYLLLACIPVIGVGNENRMLWAALVITTAAFGLWQWGRLSGRQRRMAALGLAAGAAVALAAISYLTEKRGSYEVSEDVRFEMWREWGAIAKGSPLLGYGFGKKILSEKLSTELPRALLAREHNSASHGHNLLLDVVLQVGIAGLVLFLVLVGALVRFAYRARDPARLPASAALVALVVAMLVKNATDDVMDHAVVVAFWTYAGMLVGRLLGIASEAEGRFARG